MIVVGVDPSLTGTGIIVLQNGKVENAVTVKNQPTLGVIERAREIIREYYHIYDDPLGDENSDWQPLDLVVIEGFSYGSKGKSLFEIAYLGYRIREELQTRWTHDCVPWIEVPPTQLKRFATGVGNANKEIVMQQVYKRWAYEAPNNNLADSFVLAKIGEAYLGNLNGLTQVQQGVISSLKGEKPRRKNRRKAGE